MSNILLSEATQEFILNCRIKNLTAGAILSYQQKINKFVNYVGDVPVNTITKHTIQNYILYMQDKGNKDVTINSNLSSVRALLYYCIEEGYMPNLKIKLLKQTESIPKCYTEEEVQRLLVKPSNTSSTEYKTWVLINYLLATGNRISTALEVKIEDVDFNGGYIALRQTKNRHQQIIPMSDKLALILVRYLRTRKANQEDYLFCNRKGQKLDKRTVQQLIADYNRSRGVQRTSCHSFRHTFARMYLINGGDAFRLQKLLGRSDLTMTRKYVALYSTDLKKDFNKLCPL